METSIGYAQSVGWSGLIVAMLLILLLSSNELFMRKLVEILPRYEDKWQTVEVMRTIEHDVSTYLAMITLINVGLGCVTALLMWWMGMPTPILWGAMVAAFNFIPYIGGLISTSVLILVAILEFNTIGQAILPPLTVVVLNTIEAYIVTPSFLGRRLRLNPVVIFIALCSGAGSGGSSAACLRSRC